MEYGEAQDVLDYWFSGSDLDAPTLDSRMDRWFGSDPELDREIDDRFGDLVQRASAGELDEWAQRPEGRLALIILLDQFSRQIYRDSARAFSNDSKALSIALLAAIGVS